MIFNLNPTSNDPMQEVHSAGMITKHLGVLQTISEILRFENNKVRIFIHGMHTCVDSCHGAPKATGALAPPVTIK
jgi:hypothetical protein